MPIKLTAPFDVIGAVVKVPATFRVPSFVMMLVTFRLRPPLIVKARPELTVKLLVVASETEITGSFVTPVDGICTSLAAIGTAAGVQFPGVCQSVLTAPVQVKVLVTVNVAEAVPPVPPFVEVTFPVVLTFVPLLAALTFTLNVQALLVGIVAALIEMLVAPGVGAKVPVAQEFVEAGVESTSTPVGKLSTTPAPVSGRRLPAGLVIVIVKVDTLPATDKEGKNDLPIAGGALTVKVALAVTPGSEFPVFTVTGLFFTPIEVALTVKVKLQVVAAAIVALLKLMLVAPATGSKVPVAQLFAAEGVASISIPAGKVSLNETPVKACIVFVFRIEIESCEV